MGKGNIIGPNIFFLGRSCFGWRSGYLDVRGSGLGKCSR